MDQRLVRYGIIGAIAIMTVIFLFSAWNKGKARAQSSVILKNAVAVTSALANFYSDQNRYPTTVEFTSPEAMGIYLNPFPPVQVSSKNCSGSLVYRNPSPKSYNLFICLPIGFDNYATGLNQFSAH